MTVATPSLFVTTVRADSVPKSCGAPFTIMSIRIGTPVLPRPSGPIAVTLIDDCDPPSWLMLSGIALNVSVSASPDGPGSGGGVEPWPVHPAAARSASATAPRRKNVDDMVLLIPE